jgi:hypothetical protein
VKIEIDEAENGWIIRSTENRREPRIFEFDGTNRYRTTLEVRMVAVERALNHVLNEMIGSVSYKVKITEDIDDAKPIAEPVVQPAFDVSDQALSR